MAQRNLRPIIALCLRCTIQKSATANFSQRHAITIKPTYGRSSGRLPPPNPGPPNPPNPPPNPPAPPGGIKLPGGTKLPGGALGAPPPEPGAPGPNPGNPPPNPPGPEPVCLFRPLISVRRVSRSRACQSHQSLSIQAWWR
jgi:hypothetical protein